MWAILFPRSPGSEGSAKWDMKEKKAQKPNIPSPSSFPVNHGDRRALIPKLSTGASTKGCSSLPQICSTLEMGSMSTPSQNDNSVPQTGSTPHVRICRSPLNVQVQLFFSRCNSVTSIITIMSCNRHHYLVSESFNHSKWKP